MNSSLKQAVAVRAGRSISYLVGQNLFSQIIGVVGFAIVARVLPAGQIGILAIVGLILSGLDLVASPIESDAVAKYLGESLASGNRGRSSAIFYRSLVADVSVSAFIMGAILVLAQPISLAAFGSQDNLFLIQVLALEIPLNSGLLPVLFGATKAMQRFDVLAGIFTLRSMLRQVFGVTILLRWQPVATSVVAGWVVADVLVCLVLLLFVVGRLGHATFMSQVLQLFRFSLPLKFLDLGSYTYEWFDFAVLARLVSLSSVGIYEVVIVVFTVSRVFPSLIGDVLFPTYVELEAKEGQVALERATFVASRYISYVSLPISLGLIVVSPQLLWLVAGQSYVTGSGTLGILALFQSFSFLTIALIPVAKAIGATGRLFGVSILSMTAGAALAVGLVPIFGIAGAATARGVTMLLSLGLLLVVLRRTFKVQFDKEAILKGAIASLGMSLCVVAVQFLLAALISAPLILLPVQIVTGIFAYVLLLRALHAIHNYDLTLIQSLLGNHFQPILSWIGGNEEATKSGS